MRYFLLVGWLWLLPLAGAQGRRPTPRPTRCGCKPATTAPGAGTWATALRPARSPRAAAARWHRGRRAASGPCRLHDALAPGLTALHLAWQGRQVRQALAHGPPALAEAYAHTEALLHQLRHEVRTLSQALLPALPGAPLPLPEAVTLLTKTMSLTDDGPLVTGHCDAATAAYSLAWFLGQFAFYNEELEMRD